MQCDIPGTGIRARAARGHITTAKNGRFWQRCMFLLASPRRERYIDDKTYDRIYVS